MYDPAASSFALPRLRDMTPVAKTLLAATLAVFLVQWVVDRAAGNSFSWLFGLSRAGLARGWIWQPVTYLFLHDGTRPFHLLVNLLALYFLGPPTERGLGPRSFLLLYLGSGALGGAGWLFFGARGICIGASGAVFGLLGAFASMYPHRPVTFLLFFVLPITVRAWVLAAVLTGMELLMMISRPGGEIAYAAHVGGAVAGWAWVAFNRTRRRSATPRRNGKPRPPPDDREVDRLLDKIAREGMGRLSPSERATLSRASLLRRGRGR